MTRKAALYNRVQRLIDANVIRSVQIEGCMPGLRWTLEGMGTFGTRSYATGQLDDFLTGAESALYRPCRSCGSHLPEGN